MTTGLWYDDTYNRKLSPPMQTDGLGNPGGNCPGTIGTNVAWDEAIDLDLTKLDGGCAFRPRCRFAIDKCGEARPPLERVGEASHFAACFRSAELLAAQAVAA